MKEKWKPIKGYENDYEVSNLGNVRSKTRTHIQKTFYGQKEFIYKSKILKDAISNWGYKIVVLSKNNKHKTHMIHRLVAETFIPNLENKPQVNHIDGNRFNNKVDNLEWCTSAENIQHAYRIGLNVAKKGKNSHMYGKKGKENPKSIAVIQYDKNNKKIKEWDSMTQAGEKLNINRICIGLCCKGNLRTAGGFIWKYKEEI